ANNVINSTHILHFTLPPEPGKYPTVIHLIGGIMKSFKASDEDEDVLYAHGYIPEAVTQRIPAPPDGIRVCIAASKVYSYYCGYTPFSHGITFQSAVIHGVARVIEYTGTTSQCKAMVGEDEHLEEEKLWALHNIVGGMFGGDERWKDTRLPFKNEEVKRVFVLRVDIDRNASEVHSRQGIFGLEAGWEYSDSGDNYWEGAIPIWETYGDLIKGNTGIDQSPQYLVDLFDKRKGDNKAVAEEEAKKPYQP
ncbi:hypothetical protein BO94DRAFT_479984, partial [Aspergillus sclerotioniger CBS 115572]